MSGPDSGRHASDRLIAGYARGDGLADDELWALEAHLEACSHCRDRLAGAPAPEVAALVESVWGALRPRLGGIAPAPPRRRLGWATPWRTRWGSVWAARWATPVLAPWVLMTVLVTAFGALLGRLSLGDVSLVLLVAPVLPVAGVAVSWGRGLDPAHEVVAATPRAGLGLLARRTAAVLAVELAVVLPALLAAGWAGGATVALWLLPCLAFTAGTLLLGGFVGMVRAAMALAGVWAVVIMAPTALLSRTSFALQPDSLPVWGALAALGIAGVVARRSAYTLLGAYR
ncbi:zf-HC2 domain-containing protein [Nonomuraea sp. SBT364]|uniref:zf-HC2 domain-containing protein n=1 Tax=Nonomuraea sp. SBT364 TaxID=1580530 RepID=UPI00066A5A06|nr:zf-HC2 domain-containing protein [Nonomuraea sp. SBT364]